MKLKQHQNVGSIEQRETIVLRSAEDPAWSGDTITLQVQSLPPDYDERAEEMVASPTPRRLGPELDKNGRVRIDEDGDTVYKFDTDSKDFRRRLRRANKLQSVFMITEGLVPGQIEFEADLDPDDPQTWLEAVERELKDFGFTIGDFMTLVSAIGRVSKISEKDIEKATQGFTFPAAETGATEAEEERAASRRAS